MTKKRVLIKKLVAFFLIFCFFCFFSFFSFYFSFSLDKKGVYAKEDFKELLERFYSLPVELKKEVLMNVTPLLQEFMLEEFFKKIINIPIIFKYKDVDNISLSSDGRYLVMISKKVLKVYDLVKRKEAYSLVACKEITSVSFNKDLNMIIFGCKDGLLQLWDLSLNKITFLHSQISKNPVFIKFFDDGILVAYQQDSKLYFLDFYGKILKVFDNEVNFKHICVSQNNEKCAFINDFSIKFVDLVSGKITNVFVSEEKIKSCCFSKDGKMFACGFENGKMSIFSFNGSYKILNTFIAHGGVATSLEFSADNNKLLVALTNRTLKVWDIKFQKVIKSFLNRKTVRVMFVNSQSIFTLLADGRVEKWCLASKYERSIERMASFHDEYWNADKLFLLYILYSFKSICGNKVTLTNFRDVERVFTKNYFLPKNFELKKIYNRLTKEQSFLVNLCFFTR